jgi:hypothetical protein
MRSPEQIQIINNASTRIIELVEERNEMPTSDFQASIEAVIMSAVDLAGQADR